MRIPVVVSILAEETDEISKNNFTINSIVMKPLPYFVKAYHDICNYGNVSIPKLLSAGLLTIVVDSKSGKKRLALHVGKWQHNTTKYRALMQDTLKDYTEDWFDRVVTTPPSTKYITTDLYDALYLRHLHNAANGDTSPKWTLPDAFQPKLCNYQERAVSWLLRREQQVDQLPELYIKIEAQDNETITYFNTYSKYFVAQRPEVCRILPPGGILADEMGLGKTVEIIALIMLHKRAHVADYAPLFEPLQKKRREDVAIIEDTTTTKATLFCICTGKTRQNLVQCTQCHLWQHIACVAKYDDEHVRSVNDPYLCPSCWRTLTRQTLLETRATIIVTPQTIITQWLAELKRHVKPSLRVHIYSGIKGNNWISPRQLADYDVVLTDYNVLRSEIYHTEQHVSERVTRNKPRSMRMHTPLLMLEWWRVCVDEAQMVESNTSKVTALVRLLPAINRWAVTGTPIQRSIDDLNPLLKFLGLHIVTESSAWMRMVDDFEQTKFATDACHRLLVTILAKCMWRTCKSKVENELQIPPQTEVVHRIAFSNLEMLFYTEEHVECEDEFDVTVRKYLNRTIEYKPTITPQVLKMLLQPVLKIRQCCSIPVVMSGKQQSAHIQKQFLQPKELHAHLKSANEIDCKSALRTMASSYNGLAGICFVQKHFDRAIHYYKMVMKVVSDYTVGNITVDSLLQIHALHNMLEAYYMSSKPIENCTADELPAFEKQCYALEWKYLESYAATLTTVQNAVLNAKQNLSESALQAGTNLMDFLATLVELIAESDAQSQELLMHRIHDELMPQFADNEKLRNVRSVRAVLYLINLWYDKTAALQKQLATEFKSLRFFTENVRTRNQVSPAIWREMMQFVNSVSDCHLSEIREQKEGTKKVQKSAENTKKAKLSLCKLCSIRDSLNQLECLLYNKTIDEITNLTDGADVPAAEICLIKLIFGFTKTKHKHLTPTINKHLEALDCLQSLCKKMIKFWIEIEYTVKAYDEIDMCKMRISTTDCEEEKSDFRVFATQLNTIRMRQLTNLQTAEHQFALKLSRLNYIKQLENDIDPGPCPICHSDEETRYAVFECGHPLCLACLKLMRQYERRQVLTCSICRSVQHLNRIYYMTRLTPKSIDNYIEIKGNYSSKIIYIVRTVLQLKRAQTQDNTDPLKILIFSQWPPILKALSIALFENGISLRLQSRLKSQAVADFKNPELSITCLLMPLAHGSKGLNLIEATHVFLTEPILNPADELQAIGRVHRFGQTKPTTVHRFVVDDTIEENIFNLVTAGVRKKNFDFDNISLDDLRGLFRLSNTMATHLQTTS